MEVVVKIENYDGIDRTTIRQLFQFSMRDPDLSRNPKNENYVVDHMARVMAVDYDLDVNEAYSLIYKYTDAHKLEIKTDNTKFD